MKENWSLRAEGEAIQLLTSATGEASEAGLPRRLRFLAMTVVVAGLKRFRLLAMTKEGEY